MNTNLKAFLDTIAYSEGTDNGKQRTSNHGYDVLVGGDTFDDYSDHPRKLVWIKPKLASTAAGRYQLLSRYWDFYKDALKLPDFGPDSQDAVAIQQIKESKALDYVKKGYFEQAITNCAHIWASLPGAGYAQHENSMASLEAYYKAHGGTVA